MYSNSNQRKASKGSVRIKNSNGRLQLVFTFVGKRHYLSLGVDDTPQSRKLAEMKAREIELDMLSGNFDATLSKYKPESALTVEALDITPAITPTVSQVWRGYCDYKATSWKETTLNYHQTTFTPLFERLGEVSLMDAIAVKQRLGKVTTVHQTKRALMQLNAACRWGLKHGVISSNPYEGMAGEMPKYRYQLDPKPNAFTEEESEAAIQAFKNHKGNWNGRGYGGISYAHYAPLVEFLFLTGCRPSEAIGLQWKNISDDCGCVHFVGSIALSKGRPTRVEGSKNNKKRRFPCSDRLRKLLLSIRPDILKGDALVFQAPKGGVINYGNFSRRAWERIVDPIKPETTPYSCRDTFITLQILHRVPETVIAEWCDTSVEMIQKHYADFLKLLSLRPID